MTMSGTVNRHPNVTCDLCGTPMYRRPSTLAINAGKFCSRACRNTAHPLPDGRNFPVHHGAENPAWKGGVTYRKRHGNYVSVRYVRCPPDLLIMARADGYVMEHRLVMARRIKRPLLRIEVVHHEDHAPLNNDPSNLELLPSQAEHCRGHATKNRKCEVPGCDEKHFCKGKCRVHYRQWIKEVKQNANQGR